MSRLRGRLPKGIPNKSTTGNYAAFAAGVCVPYECAATTESGNQGCGSGNLDLPSDWCQPGAYNPFTMRRYS